MINNIVEFTSKKNGEPFLFFRKEGKSKWGDDEVFPQEKLKVPENWKVKKSKEGIDYFYLAKFPKISQWKLPIFPVTADELETLDSVVTTYIRNKDDIEEDQEQINELIEKDFADFGIALDENKNIADDYYEKQDICESYLKRIVR